MDIRRVGVVIALAAASCGSSIDARTESARKRILALDVAEASRIVTFCTSWRQDGALRGVITFEWWNNSHVEEDEPHPGFELICSEHAVAGAKPIAAGLWYRDAPMNHGG